MRSMGQPRRSRAERILGSSTVRDARFVTRIRILVPDTSVLPEQASRGGAICGVGAMTLRRLPRKLATLRNYLGTGDRCRSTHPLVVMPAVRSIEHPSGGTANSQYPSDKRAPDLTRFTAR